MPLEYRTSGGGGWGGDDDDDNNNTQRAVSGLSVDFSLPSFKESSFVAMPMYSRRAQRTWEGILFLCYFSPFFVLAPLEQLHLKPQTSC